jgi:hypothetical protein
VFRAAESAACRYDSCQVSEQSLEPRPQPLLAAQLWPLTGAYAFFDAGINEVAEMLAAWRRGLDLQPVEERVTGALLDVLGLLQPMSLGHRELLLPTRSSWTAYFSNGRTGADEGPVGQIARMLRCRAVYLVWWPVSGYESVRFQLLAGHPTEFLNHERTVDVGRDDGGHLVFTAKGTPQPYEDLEAYRSRRLAHRLTPMMVDRYCAVLGLRPFDSDFFESDGLVITSRDHRPDLRFTVSDQQARYGFRPVTE